MKRYQVFSSKINFLILHDLINASVGITFSKLKAKGNFVFVISICSSVTALKALEIRVCIWSSSIDQFPYSIVVGGTSAFFSIGFCAGNFVLVILR